MSPRAQTKDRPTAGDRTDSWDAVYATRDGRLRPGMETVATPAGRQLVAETLPNVAAMLRWHGVPRKRRREVLARVADAVAKQLNTPRPVAGPVPVVGELELLPPVTCRGPRMAAEARPKR